MIRITYARETAKNKRSLTAWRSLITATASLVLGACITTDFTKNEASKELVDHCFTTVTEAIFTSRECWRGAWKYCDIAMPLSPSANGRVGYPPTLQAFRNDPGAWTTRIHEANTRGQPGLEPDRVEIYGGLPIGTQITIDQVVKKFDGENGSYWMVFASIQNGEFKGRRVLLPKAETSVVNSQYLARCDNAAIASSR